MSENVMVEAAQEAKSGGGWTMFLGVLVIIIGVLAMGSPFMAGLAVTVWVGFMLIVGGVLRTFFAFKAQSFGAGLLGVIIGALTVLCGLVMVGRPLLGLTSLTLFLAAYFFVDGIFEITHGFQLRPMKGWGWMVTGGVVSLLLGLMIWRQWPMSGSWAVGVLFGIHLLFSGFSMVGIGGAIRKVATDVQEAEAAS